MNGAKFQFLGRRHAQPNAMRRGLARNWLQAVLTRRRHDPLLVLNMSVFNFTDSWERTFSKINENLT